MQYPEESLFLSCGMIVCTSSKMNNIPLFVSRLSLNMSPRLKSLISVDFNCNGRVVNSSVFTLIAFLFYLDDLDDSMPKRSIFLAFTEARFILLEPHFGFVGPVVGRVSSYLPPN